MKHDCFLLYTNKILLLLIGDVLLNRHSIFIDEFDVFEVGLLLVLLYMQNNTCGKE